MPRQRETANATTVVIPLDGSEIADRALGPAADLARRLDAAVEFVSAVADSHEVPARRHLLDTRAGVFQRDFDEPPRLSVRVDPHIIDTLEAEATPDHIVCMGTSANLWHTDGYVGSMAERLVRRSGEPTVLIGPKADLARGFDFERVILATDGSEHANAASPVAVRWATWLDLPLWLVNVTDPDAAAKAMAAGIMESAPVHRLADRLHEDGVASEIEWETLHHANPGRALVDFAGDDGLLVISTHGRSGMGRLLMGSTAAFATRHARRPLVAFCPATLDAPVRT